MGVVLRWLASVAVVVAVCGWGGLAIPSRVANRMIPSWWLSARAERTCTAGSQCGPGECCVRPMLATNSYCFPFKALGETCDAFAMLLDMDKEVYFDHCPCHNHLTCANLRVTSICIDPGTVHNTHRLAIVPKPVQIDRGMP